MNVQGIILASQSETRARLLVDANLNFLIEPAYFDEETYISKNKKNITITQMVRQLANEKARSISFQRPDYYVIGADSILEIDGEIIQKSNNIAEAKELLQRMRGKAHFLHSSVCVHYNGMVVFEECDSAKLEFFDFSDAFIDNYLAEFGDAILSSVGCVRIEAEGVRLLSKITGNYYTIMGMPLLALINFFRKHNLIEV